MYSEKLESCGFVRGMVSPVTFEHPERDMACVVHGDDFTFEGEEEDLRWITELMRGWFDIKMRGIIGPEEHDLKEMSILGRTVRFKDWGIEYEADPKHRRVVLEFFGFQEGTRELQGNGSPEEAGEKEDEEGVGGSHTEYRALVARLNYLAQDSPELVYPVMECSRGMSDPKAGDWRK
jgi:hypothetical protein